MATARTRRDARRTAVPDPTAGPNPRRLRPGAPRTLVSLAGLVGRPVHNQHGHEVGRLDDVVTRWDDPPYPAVTGAVVRVGRRRVFLPAAQLDHLRRDGVTLRSATVDLRDFAPRPGELALGRHLLDRQLIDVDGVRVVRASDLYLARVGDVDRLVAVDVGLQSLVRRLGPRRFRSLPTPTRVLDWAAVQPFAAPGSAVQLGRTHQALRRLRPADLAALLEELGRVQRRDLVSVLDPVVAAEALEEMDAQRLDVLLGDLGEAQAAHLLAEMAPDEAADALRAMAGGERERVLAELEPAAAAALRGLAAHGAHTAGAAMTTVLLRAGLDEPVDQVRRRVAEGGRAVRGLDGVLVVDAAGRLVDDVSFLELFTAPAGAVMADLAAPPYPVAVHADDDLASVVRTFVDSRGTSVVVVDGAGRPVGCILADDVIDALVDGGRPDPDRRGP